MKKQSMQGLPTDFRDRILLLKILKRGSLFLCITAFLLALFNWQPICFAIGISAHLMYAGWFILAVKTYRQYGDREYCVQMLERGPGIKWDPSTFLIILLSIVMSLECLGDAWDPTGHFFLVALLLAIGCMLWGDHVLCMGRYVKTGVKWLGMIMVTFLLSCTLMTEINLLFAQKTAVYTGKIIEFGGRTSVKGGTSYWVAVQFDGWRGSWGGSRAQMNMLSVGDEIQAEEFHGPLWMEWRRLIFPQMEGGGE